MAVLNTLTAKLLKFAKRTTRQESVRRPTPEENILRALERVEPYVVWLQSILIWEKPLQTLFTYFCFNVLFWLAVSLNFRFYFLLFSTTCVVLIYEMWADKVWPEIRVPLPAEQGDKEDWTPLHPRVLSAPELSHYLKKGMQYAHQQYIWLQSLRSNQPGVFCALASIVCIVLMWIGSSVSGTMLLYLIFMLLLLIPGICIHILPSVSQLAHLEQMKSKDDESDVDEYLPEQSGSNMVFLERAVEPDNSDHEEEEDFIPSTEILHLDDMCDSGAPSLTFVHGIKDMPAHEDLSLDSTDFGLEISHSNEDKAPSAQPGRNKRTLDLDINSSDSDGSISPPESETAGFRFKNRHFKGDSSSEEENVPSRNSGPKSKAESGGKGSSGAVADAAAAVLSYSSAGAINLASLGASVGQSLIASVISNAASAPISRSVPVKEEDEEDDALSDVEGFEVISEEEFANL